MRAVMPMFFMRAVMLEGRALRAAHATEIYLTCGRQQYFHGLHPMREQGEKYEKTSHAVENFQKEGPVVALVGGRTTTGRRTTTV